MASDPKYESLHFTTVSLQLRRALEKLMTSHVFDEFRLVGGTNLSLKFGHRKSDDIDLFTDREYGSLDFTPMEHYLADNFPYYETPENSEKVGFGRMYYIGENSDNCIKLDLMYTDPFMYPAEKYGAIRMAQTKDIIAMKIQAISNGARKKDFWDLHMLLDFYSLEDMLDFHKKRHPYEHDRNDILKRMTDFKSIEDTPDPICLLGKDWDEIKLDLIDAVAELS